MRLTFEEALASVDGFGWVHWSTWYGPFDEPYSEEQYAISQAQRTFSVETGHGLNLDKNLDHMPCQNDLREHLRNLGWPYQGSGWFEVEVPPDTPITDAWGEVLDET